MERRTAMTSSSPPQRLCSLVPCRGQPPLVCHSFTWTHTNATLDPLFTTPRLPCPTPFHCRRTQEYPTALVGLSLWTGSQTKEVCIGELLPQLRLRGWWLGWERGGAGGNDEDGRTRTRVVRVVSTSPKDAGECPWRRGWSESYVYIHTEVIEKRVAVWKVAMTMGHHRLRKARRGARGGRSPPRRLLAQRGAGATPWKEADTGRHTSWPGDGWPMSAPGPSGPPPPPPLHCM